MSKNTKPREAAPPPFKASDLGHFRLLREFRDALAKAQAEVEAHPSFLDARRKLELGDKIEVKRPSRGTEAVAMVARGEAVFSIQPVSEILNMPGVQLGGTIPATVRPPGLFVGAIFAGSTRLDEAGRLLAFLASDAARGAIERAGMEQPR